MFHSMPNLHLNQMVLAAAGAMFKGAEKQQEQDKLEEQEKQMNFIVFQDDQKDELIKTNDAQGRLA